MKTVTRSQWGARPPNCADPLPPIDAVVVHYSASDADEESNHANCDARVRGIQNYHMDTQGWCDIAYNYVVCKHGYVFVGRGDNRSAATGDANSHTIAVCFLGDDTAGKSDPTKAGYRALGQIIRFLRAKHNPAAKVTGHRDYMSTSCPGDEIYAWVRRGGWKKVQRYKFVLRTGEGKLLAKSGRSFRKGTKREAAVLKGFLAFRTKAALRELRADNDVVVRRERA